MNELMETDRLHSSLCLSDDLFQKVAEDYNNTAFQFMTGECFVHIHSFCINPLCSLKGHLELFVKRSRCSYSLTHSVGIGC